MNENVQAPGGDVFAADLLRGHTETIVLGALRDRDRYGFEIFKVVREATGGAYEIKEATLYATYRRLTKDGLVEPYWGDESQGGRRKYYRITDAGLAVYRANVAAWVATRDVIDSLLGTGSTGTHASGTAPSGTRQSSTHARGTDR